MAAVIVSSGRKLSSVHSVHENGDGDAYHAFRHRQRHQRLYAVPYPHEAAIPLDLHALEPHADVLPALAA